MSNEEQKTKPEIKPADPANIMQLIGLKSLHAQSVNGNAYIVPSSKEIKNDELPEIKRIQ